MTIDVTIKRPTPPDFLFGLMAWPYGCSPLFSYFKIGIKTSCKIGILIGSTNIVISGTTPGPTFEPFLQTGG